MKKKFCLPIAIATFVILAVVTCLCVKGNQHDIVKGEYTKAEYSQYLSQIYGYNVEESRFSMKEGDPQLHFDFSDTGAHGLKLNFKKPVEVELLQVYFGRTNPIYTENDSRLIGSKGATSVEFTDVETFHYIRLDINGDFELDSVEIMYELEREASQNVVGYIWSLVLSLLLALIVGICPFGSRIYASYIQKLTAYYATIKKNKIVTIKLIITTFLIAGISLASEFVYAVIMKQPHYNEYRVIAIFVALFIVYITLLFRKWIFKYAHIYFFVVLMLIGTVQVIGTPSISGTAWDGEIHYGRTAFLSWGADDKISYADNKMVSQKGSDVYTNDGRTVWEQELNAYSKENNTLFSTNNYEVSVKYVAYIPSAIALSLGRGLGLSYIATFMLGKWTSLLVYALAFSVSIKALKRGKMIAAVIGLIPTNIFLAASYSYDAWVTCFVVLGYSLFLGDIQKENKISTKKLIAILVIMVIGILPKAIYFPLIFPLLLFRKDRYENSKLARALVCIGVLVLIFTFVMPYLVGSAGSGDSRGGTGVNAIEQMKFILTEPLSYAEILLNFLKGYLSLDTSYLYLTFFAYVGQAKYFTVCILAIAMCCILDNSREEKPTQKKESVTVNVGIIIAAFGSIVLAATAMYVSFTPVAAATINGCQPRYIIPVLFPLLFSLCRMRIRVPDKIRTNAMAIAVLAMAYVFLNGMYTLCIGAY